MRKKTIYALFIAILLASCNSLPKVDSDKSATKETRILLQKMQSLSENGIMVGYEDALAYGLDYDTEWWGDEKECDMYRVSGKHPSVYGWDIGDIHKSENLDSIPFSEMIQWIKDVHHKGGINTVSWHIDNPPCNPVRSQG